MPAPLPVTLPEFKDYLDLAAGTSEKDTELARALQAATEAVERRIGPIVVRAVTELASGRGGCFVLGSLPVVSITSVTNVATSAAVDVADLIVLSGGVVTGPVTNTTYEVTYRAGRADIPENLRLAVLIVADHLWEAKRGQGAHPKMFGGGTAGGGGVSSSDEASYVYRGFALPRRALELLLGEEGPGFA